MIEKEQIAHELTLVYLRNRYGVDISGDFYISDSNGNGTIETEHFPSASEPRYMKVQTPEKGLLVIPRGKKVPIGNNADDLFQNMVRDYYNAYEHFLHLVSEREG